MKTFLLLLIPLLAWAQNPHGRVLEDRIIESDILGREVNYTIYLPYDYDSSQRYYPLVYLLHGYTDDDSAWLQFGRVQHTADAAIGEGKIPAMIIVMPDAGVSWYVNSYDGSVRYEDFFMEELLAHIEETYRVRPGAAFRGLAGLSMGGYGTLVYMLKHPDKFAAGAALSAGLFTEEEVLTMPDERWNRMLGPVFGKAQSKKRLSAHYKANSPLDIVTNGDAASWRGLHLWIDCGDDDFLSPGNAELHMALRQKNIPHEYRVRDGGHRWSYWRSGLEDALQFIAERFIR